MNSKSKKYLGLQGASRRPYAARNDTATGAADVRSALQWDGAANLIPVTAQTDSYPQGALVRNTQHARDQIAVVYDKGQTPPKITITQVSGSVHTVMADGVAVAVVAKASGPAPSVDDVVLVERSI